MRMVKIIIFLGTVLAVSSTRLFAVHPEQRFGRNISPLSSSSGDAKSRNVQNWLENYQDLIGKFIPSEQDQISTTTTPATTSSTTSRSLLLSLFSDFIPYLTGGDNAVTQSSDINHGHPTHDSSNLVRRQGLAFNTDNVHTSRLARRPGRRKKRRRSTTTTTTERYEEQSGGSNAEPDLKNFCRHVIKTMATSLEQDHFKQVSMYQDIWYLISKYNIPVPDHDTDIVLIINNLCQDNHNQPPRKQKPFDNNVEIDRETNSFVYHSPEPEEASSSYYKYPENTFYSSTTTRTSKLTTKRPRRFRNPYRPNMNGYIFDPPLVADTISLPPRKENLQQLTRSQYPRVRYHGPKQKTNDNVADSNTSDDDDSGNEIFSGSLNKNDGGKSTENRDKLMTNINEYNEPITLHPDLIEANQNSALANYHFQDNKPQDIVVASSLSFAGSSHQLPKLTRGQVFNADTDDDDDHEEGLVTGGHNVRRFTPSELVSSTVKPSIKTSVSRTDPTLRRGTVEDVPVLGSKPTLPPSVKTVSGLSVENEVIDDNPVKIISSTLTPSLSASTFKTSKLDTSNIRGKSKYYKSYLKDLIDNYYEEPERSEEEPVTDTKLNKFKKHMVGAPGFYPRPREPYPYKNLAMPLPYLSAPSIRHREFDRENLMSNKMDNLKFIDGYVDGSELSHNHNKHHIRPAPASIKPQIKSDHNDDVRSRSSLVTTTVPTPVSGVSLTLDQLSTKLSQVTEASVESDQVTRDYTVFDMADAVTVTEPHQDHHHNHHQHHQMISYSEDAPSRVRPDNINDDMVASYTSLRPDYVEYDQFPSPASNIEDKLIVDMTDRAKRNVSIDDLLFLYNITFLTESQEMLQQYKDLEDFNINLMKSSEDDSYQDYSSLLDYSDLPLPDYQSLNTADKFNDALEDFLEDYEDYSNEQIRDQKADQHEDIDDVEKMLTDMIGEAPLSADLLGDVFSDYYEEDYEDDYEDVDDDSWSAGHRVNHMTHSVPEFANKLISQQRQAETVVTSGDKAGHHQVSLHKNHKPFHSPIDQDLLVNQDGIKEVLMVLNKTNPGNKTRAFHQPYQTRTEVWPGYYPDDEMMTSDDDQISDDIDTDIEYGAELSLESAETDSGEFRISEPDNDDQNSEILADLLDITNDVSVNNTEAAVEEKKYYPVSEENNNDDDTEEEVEIDPQNLSDNILDSWDTSSDEFLSNDQFINELEKEKLEKTQLEELLGSSVIDDAENSENFPLKGLPEMKDHQDKSIRTRTNNTNTAESEGINPEKLAYILIGVCCGLSILCLIVVAISIGYKSETHYRLEEPRRKHIRLLKANNSDEDSSSNSSDQDDKSRAKLGNWFTGKRTIETMERKSTMVFPTSVYLDNLASSATHSTMSSGQSSPAGGDKHANMFEVERAESVENIADHNNSNNSSSDGSSLTSDNITAKNYDADSIDLHLEQSRRKQFIKAHKNKSSYNLTSGVKHNKIDNNVSPQGKFRRNSNVTVKSNNNEKFTETEITWSENTDRLI